MLRAVVITLVALLLAASVFVDIFAPSGMIPVTLGLACVLVGLIFEQHRYRRFADAAPGGDFQPTDEKFIDPETNQLVQVFADAKTGARRYVALHDANDTP